MSSQEISELRAAIFRAEQKLRILESNVNARHSSAIRTSIDPSDISGASDGVLVASAGTVTITTVDVSLPVNVAGLMRVQNGGTGQTAFAKGDFLAGTAVAGVTTKIPVGADQTLLYADATQTGGALFQFLRITNRTSDPGSPATGEIWLRTDL